MLRAFGVYNRALNAYPMLTQCVTTGALLAAGDGIAQIVVEKQKHYNWERTARFGVFGLCFLGPVLTKWFRTLERLYGATGKLTPLKKVATDQLVFAPILQLVNIPVLGALNRDSWHKIKSTVRNDYYDIMIANWCLWPFVGLVNFFLVPLNYRVPVVAVVSLFWNIYYTWKLGAKAPKV